MRADPAREDYLKFFETQYDRVNYSDRSLAGRVLGHGHTLMERDLGPDRHFSTVLEVGAGQGQHVESVRHGFDRYIMTDWAIDAMCQRWDTAEQRARGIECRVADATRLDTFPANFADRLIASHVLEHLPEPHAVLREWSRVVKPGGLISIALPCDPGLAWRLGRNFGPRRANKRAGNLHYDYWMAREHINAIQNLYTFVEFYFPQRTDRWFPLGVRSFDFNLLFVTTVVNDKSA
ncbi:MAG: methyltransferase domain-containing protein [Hyphomicrobiaceae bacterium]